MQPRAQAMQPKEQKVNIRYRSCHKNCTLAPTTALQPRPCKAYGKPQHGFCGSLIKTLVKPSHKHCLLGPGTAHFYGLRADLASQVGLHASKFRVGLLANPSSTAPNFNIKRLSATF